MTQLRKLTEQEAYFYLDFVSFRIFGWNIVDRIKHHPNSNACKAVDKRFRDLIGNQPSVNEFINAAMNGEPVHLLWPPEMQDEVKRAITSVVPRAVNEPTSDEFIQGMHEDGRTDWVIPDFIKELRS
ncbi:hypothetical protein [Rhizobium sophoriradicis]|uniref:Uncharacterized protein n=1 Tax=Rhizobium sophoriradicis TaxID=1535245 RepID=A0A2A5KLJ2_9HYPH|nr:hypothetical protein [Rhizobium sophoriradicis]PCK77875.1 hypothetical protein CPT34_27815 [Rhizobium sophoriradicis]